jgi:phosphinothricin acetyltransferase
MNIKLRAMLPDDWYSVAAIYKDGIDTGIATFEKTIPLWENWNKAHIKSCRIVAEAEDVIAGWAALMPVSGRSVYSGVAEVSVYVSDNYKGQKIGTFLLDALIKESEKEGFWTLQASIFRENPPSLRIHKNLGFREVGFRERIGKLNGIWRDTILLERRSKII